MSLMLFHILLNMRMAKKALVIILSGLTVMALI